MSFGPHVLLECKKGNSKKCGDLRFVFDFLNDLPDKIGMTKITQPYVFPYSGLVPEDRGITGVVVIAESHITYHWFECKDYLFFDAFSCKNFDTDLLLKEILENFEFEDYKMDVIHRGKDFPR